MKNILVLYYTQSGDTFRAVESFVKFLDNIREVKITREYIKPKTNYPYPWKIGNFFDVFPECINEEPPEIYPPSFDPSQKFDLVIIAYQVWFLAPALPIQSFLKSKYGKVLQDTKVITLVVCRKMWHSASERMKKMIAEVGGIHIDNVVVTHQGTPLATFITTPRLMLTGKKDKFLGKLPPAGVKDEDIQALSKFGWQIANNLAALSDSSNRPLLKGLGAVEVNKCYVIPEIIGRIIYEQWAKLARFFGKPGSWKRKPIAYLFGFHLLFTIPMVLMISMVIKILLSPILYQKIEAYIDVLKSPSASAE